jgi:hypothetical protein
VRVFYNSGKSLKDDLRHVLIVKKRAKRRRGLNEKKAFSDIAAADHFGVNANKPFNGSSWH